MDHLQSGPNSRTKAHIESWREAVGQLAKGAVTGCAHGLGFAKRLGNGRLGPPAIAWHLYSSYRLSDCTFIPSFSFSLRTSILRVVLVAIHLTASCLKRPFLQMQKGFEKLVHNQELFLAELAALRTENQSQKQKRVGRKGFVQKGGSMTVQKWQQAV
ncbi:hypothetical protein M433DRAFT_9317 [Acidomyces richmondensis BFW]|nr:hypothetical protein M433DRAFT_9317 [Acidomyces richmondensis BFW]